MTDRPSPPDLEWALPDCPFCMKETSTDGSSIWCDHCDATWSAKGEHGEWYDPSAPQCPAIDGRWLPGGRSHHIALSIEGSDLATALTRCVRSAGHNGDHCDADGGYWADKDNATEEQIKQAMVVSEQ